MKKKFSVFLCFVFCSLCFAQSRFSLMPHLDKVTSVQYDLYSDGGSFFSTGKDGFIVLWNKDGKAEHFQLSNYEIKFASLNPVRKEIAVYETDGNSVNTVSVWNLSDYTKKFSYDFKDSVLSLSYSKKGNYVIVGTLSDKGTVFINAATGKFEKPFFGNLNMITYAETAGSEKSLMSYALTGSISYHELSTGKLLKKIQTEPALENVVSFNRNKFIAGKKDKKIFIINAMSGEKVFEMKAVNPVLLTFEDELYYFEQLTNKTASLFRFEENKTEAPKICKNISLSGNEKISSVLMTPDQIILGTESGNIFASDKTSSTQAELLSSDMTKKILDIAYIGDDLYLLTQEFILKTNEEKTEVIKVLENQGYSNFVSYKDRLILWSQRKNTKVSEFNVTENKLKELFVSKKPVLAIKNSNGHLIEIEGSSTVNCYDFETASLKELYYGSGIQDAVIIGENNLFIAKAVSNPAEKTLIYVNTKTSETVYLDLGVDLIYCLESGGNEGNGSSRFLYAVGIMHKNGADSTVILRYDDESKTTETVKTFDRLDLHASIFAYGENLISNTLSGEFFFISEKDKNPVVLNRTCALPVKCRANYDNLVVLNTDGSISWYALNGSMIIADWYISENHTVIEY
ncbi:MAG: hypothetical protein ACI4LX_07130 [Treponema sp.]